MQLHHRTILITGGTSGIGLELARRLHERGNTVVVTGRDPERLAAVRSALPGVRAIASDVGDPASIAALFATVSAEFPSLDLLINNAGVMRKIDLQDPRCDDVTREIAVNLAGPIRMVQTFLPLLKAQQRAAIVNVSSGLAFVPLAIAPVYSATKAAMHSYTQSLRSQLRATNVTVVELAPPGTDTPLFHGDFTEEDLRGNRAMDVSTLVRHAIAGLERGRLEIRPGLSNALLILSRVAPAFIARKLGEGSDRMAAAPA